MDDDYADDDANEMRKLSDTCKLSEMPNSSATSHALTSCETLDSNGDSPYAVKSLSGLPEDLCSGVPGTNVTSEALLSHHLVIALSYMICYEFLYEMLALL